MRATPSRLTTAVLLLLAIGGCAGDAGEDSEQEVGALDPVYTDLLGWLWVPERDSDGHFYNADGPSFGALHFDERGTYQYVRCDCSELPCKPRGVASGEYRLKPLKRSGDYRLRFMSNGKEHFRVIYRHAYEQTIHLKLEKDYFDPRQKDDAAWQELTKTEMRKGGENFAHDAVKLCRSE